MPTVVQGGILFPGSLLVVNADEGRCHDCSLKWQVVCYKLLVFCGRVRMARKIPLQTGNSQKKDTVDTICWEANPDLPKGVSIR